MKVGREWTSEGKQGRRRKMGYRRKMEYGKKGFKLWRQ